MMMTPMNLSKIGMIIALLDVLVLVVVAWAPLIEDNVMIRTDVIGMPNPRPRSWADSYSDGNSCYCSTTYDHNLATVVVDTPLGSMTIRDVCTLLGDSPSGGTSNGHPLYNDIQCGNGPSVIYDEVACPGRTEYGIDGCKYIGPKWNFTSHLPKAPTKVPTTTIRMTKKPTRAPVKKAPVSQTPIKTPNRSPIKSSSVVVPTPPTTNVCRILQVDLWDTITDKVTQKKITNGTKICNTMEFSMDAITTTNTCLGYNIQFIVAGPNNYRYVRNESKSPYCLYGNAGTNIHGKILSILGTYTVSVHVVLTKNQQQQRAAIGMTKAISFEIIRC